MLKQSGFAIPYHIIAIVVIIAGLMVSTLLYKSWYAAAKTEKVQIQTIHDTFVAQETEIQKNIKERHARQMAASELKADEWRKKHEKSSSAINIRYADDKRLREQNSRLRGELERGSEKLAGIQGVKCGVGDGGRTGNFEKYYERIRTARRRLQEGIVVSGDRVFGELGKPLDQCQAELDYIKSSQKDVDLIN